MGLVRKITAIIIVLVLLLALALLIRRCIRHVPVVLVGPIDPVSDTVGLISKGMTRDQVIDILGNPLRPRDTSTEGRWFDPISTDFFPGIYAEVGWTYDDYVHYINFKLDIFKKAYRADLQVILRLPNDEYVVLSRNLNWTEAQKLFGDQKSSTIPNLQIKKGDRVLVLLYPNEKSVTLDFSRDDEKLFCISYCCFSK